MAYRITGLSPEPFAALSAMEDSELAAHHAKRVTATARPGFPCRVSFHDAERGEQLILLHHVGHDVATPNRSAYAISVHEPVERAEHLDDLPPEFQGQTTPLRGLDARGMLRGVALALPGRADAATRELLAGDDITCIHAHNAAHGCFAARVDRA